MKAITVLLLLLLAQSHAGSPAPDLEDRGLPEALPPPPPPPPSPPLLGESASVANAAGARALGDGSATETADAPRAVDDLATEFFDGDFQRVNYASLDAGAVIMGSNSDYKGKLNLLNEDKDLYALTPCDKKKWLDIKLSEDIELDSFVLANYERYSSRVKEIALLGAQKYPPPNNKWNHLGNFTADDVGGEQLFKLLEPAPWVRYVKLRFLTHYGSEFYCTLSLVRVYGTSMLKKLEDYMDTATKEVANMVGRRSSGVANGNEGGDTVATGGGSDGDLSDGGNDGGSGGSSGGSGRGGSGIADSASGGSGAGDRSDTALPDVSGDRPPVTSAASSSSVGGAQVVPVVVPLPPRSSSHGPDAGKAKRVESAPGVSSVRTSVGDAAAIAEHGRAEGTSDGATEEAAHGCSPSPPLSRGDGARSPPAHADAPRTPVTGPGVDSGRVVPLGQAAVRGGLGGASDGDGGDDDVGGDEHDALLGGGRLEEATAAAVPQSQRPESVQSSYPPLSPPAALSTTNPPHRRERAHEARGDHNSQQAGDDAIACVDVVDAGNATQRCSNGTNAAGGAANSGALVGQGNARPTAQTPDEAARSRDDIDDIVDDKTAAAIMESIDAAAAATKAAEAAAAAFRDLSDASDRSTDAANAVADLAQAESTVLDSGTQAPPAHNGDVVNESVLSSVHTGDEAMAGTHLEVEPGQLPPKGGGTSLVGEEQKSLALTAIAEDGTGENGDGITPPPPSSAGVEDSVRSIGEPPSGTTQLDAGGIIETPAEISPEGDSTRVTSENLDVTTPRPIVRGHGGNDSESLSQPAAVAFEVILLRPAHTVPRGDMPRGDMEVGRPNDDGDEEGESDQQSRSGAQSTGGAVPVRDISVTRDLACPEHYTRIEHDVDPSPTSSRYICYQAHETFQRGMRFVVEVAVVLSPRPLLLWPADEEEDAAIFRKLIDADAANENIERESNSHLSPADDGSATMTVGLSDPRHVEATEGDAYTYLLAHNRSCPVGMEQIGDNLRGGEGVAGFAYLCVRYDDNEGNAALASIDIIEMGAHDEDTVARLPGCVQVDALASIVCLGSVGPARGGVHGAAPGGLEENARVVEGHEATQDGATTDGKGTTSGVCDDEVAAAQPAKPAIGAMSNEVATKTNETSPGDTARRAPPSDHVPSATQLRAVDGDADAFDSALAHDASPFPESLDFVAAPSADAIEADGENGPGQSVVAAPGKVGAAPLPFLGDKEPQSRHENVTTEGPAEAPIADSGADVDGASGDGVGEVRVVDGNAIGSGVDDGRTGIAVDSGSASDAHLPGEERQPSEPPAHGVLLSSRTRRADEGAAGAPRDASDTVVPETAPTSTSPVLAAEDEAVAEVPLAPTAVDRAKADAAEAADATAKAESIVMASAATAAAAAEAAAGALAGVGLPKDGSLRLMLEDALSQVGDGVKGGKGPDKAQSIFKTLSNKLQALEVGQSVLTRFLEDATARYSAVIGDLRKTLAATAATVNTGIRLQQHKHKQQQLDQDLRGIRDNSGVGGSSGAAASGWNPHSDDDTGRVNTEMLQLQSEVARLSQKLRRHELALGFFAVVAAIIFSASLLGLCSSCPLSPKHRFHSKRRQGSRQRAHYAYIHQDEINGESNGGDGMVPGAPRDKENPGTTVERGSRLTLLRRSRSWACNNAAEKMANGANDDGSPRARGKSTNSLPVSEEFAPNAF